MPNPTQRRATRTAPTRTNDARTAHPGNRAHRAPTRAPCAPLPETKRARVRAPITSRVSLTILFTIIHNPPMSERLARDAKLLAFCCLAQDAKPLVSDALALDAKSLVSSALAQDTKSLVPSALVLDAKLLVFGALARDAKALAPNALARDARS